MILELIIYFSSKTIGYFILYYNKKVKVQYIRNKTYFRKRLIFIDRLKNIVRTMGENVIY